MSPTSQHNNGELLSFIAWPIIASALAFGFHFSPFVAIFVFYGPPGLYLCFKKPRRALKIGIYAVIVGTPMMIVFDYIANLTGAWHLVYNTFPPFLNYIAVEDIIFYIAWTFFTIMFYGYLVPNGIDEKLWGPRMKYVTLAMIILLASLALCVINFPKVLHIPYFYLIMGCTFGLIPIIIEIFNYPRIFLTFFGTTIYFFYFHLIHELTGLKLNWWNFPGTQFIGHVTLFGLTFPLEEFLFWIILGTFTALSYFKLFTTTQKN